MTSIILDTNAYTAFKRNDENIKHIIQRVDEIIVPSVVIGELLSGFAAGSKEQHNRQELHDFLASSRVTIAAVTEKTAIHYAKAYLILRKQGTPIPTNDLWIIAIAFEHGCGICSFDKHFNAIDYVLVGTHWTVFFT